MFNELNIIFNMIASRWRWKKPRHEVCQARKTYISVQLGILRVMQQKGFTNSTLLKKKQKKTNKQKIQNKAKQIKAVNTHCDFGVLISRTVIPIGSTKTFI